MTTDTATSAEAFSESWLTLREPVDHRSRDHDLIKRLQHWVREQSNIRILDLGCGTGSNLRYLLPKLGHEQHWTLIDNDEQLLRALPARLERWAATHKATVQVQESQIISVRADQFSAGIAMQCFDVAKDLDSLPFVDGGLVTGSALLDLASANWLDRLADRCIEHRCAVYFALNYNGLIDWHPSLEHDSVIMDLQNEHQLRDKGLGPALGPQAAKHLQQCLQSRQRQTSLANSHWQLSGSEQALATELMKGWINAADDQNPALASQIAQWHEMRLELMRSGAWSLTVGHEDLLSI